MHAARNSLIGSLVAAIAFLLILLWNPEDRSARTGGGPLFLHCAAGIQVPVEEAARAYERELGVTVQIQYGGSGTLLASLQVASRGDIFIAADESYLQTARSRGVVEEIVPLARMAPVIAVRKGNPKNVRSFEDLFQVELALANPDAAAIGSAVRDFARKAGRWEDLEKKVRVFKPTVMDVANDVKIGAVDAGIIWDSTANGYPELETVTVPGLSSLEGRISAGILRSAADPAAALRFARYLGAPEKGLGAFARFGYRPVEGDVWAEVPEVVLYSGGVNRVAIEETVRRFEAREGAKVTTVYNGCGILVSQMRAGQRPDAYLACDVSYVPPVADLFLEPLKVSETDIVILAGKGNPRSIRSLEDLARPGLRIGVANPGQSTLGSLTESLLAELGIREGVLKNVSVQTPTADLLVNQMRAGALDAAVVYQANASEVWDSLSVIPIGHPRALAVQPYAVGKGSKHRLLMGRLLDAILSAESQRKFESVGFRFLGGKR